jgi:hypothetical protein
MCHGSNRSFRGRRSIMHSFDSEKRRNVAQVLCLQVATFLPSICAAEEPLGSELSPSGRDFGFVRRKKVPAFGRKYHRIGTCLRISHSRAISTFPGIVSLTAQHALSNPSSRAAPLAPGDIERRRARYWGILMPRTTSGTESTTGEKFYATCGSPLSQRCPKYNSENVPPSILRAS